MTGTRRFLSGLLAVALVLGGATWALASEGAGSPSSEQVLKLRIIQILGFAIVFAILAIYAFPFIGRLLGKRSSGIARDFEDVETGKQAALDAEKKAQADVADSERTSGEVLEAAGKEGVRLRQSLVSEADKTAARIRAKGRIEVEVERARTLLQCQNAYALEAFAITEESLRGAIDRKRHNAIVKRFFQDLDAIGG